MGNMGNQFNGVFGGMFKDTISQGVKDDLVLTAGKAAIGIAAAYVRSKINEDTQHSSGGSNRRETYKSNGEYNAEQFARELKADWERVRVSDEELEAFKKLTEQNMAELYNSKSDKGLEEFKRKYHSSSKTDKAIEDFKKLVEQEAAEMNNSNKDKGNSEYIRSLEARIEELEKRLEDKDTKAGYVTGILGR